MKSYFNVTKARFNECKALIRTLPSARFICNPDEYKDHYRISLELEVEDFNKLDELLKKYCLEDHPPVVKISFWQKLKALLKP